MNHEYKLSGKSGNILIFGLLIGPVLITILSLLYAYIDVYNPFVYFTFLVFLGLLYAVIITQKIVILLAKCRSRQSAIIYGFSVGVFGVYASWCSFAYVLFQKESLPQELLDIMLNPNYIYEVTNLLATDGYFSIFNHQVKGTFLWLIWIIEAVGILLAGVLGGMSVLHEQIFCEKCNQWVDDLEFDLRLSIDDKDSAQKCVESDLTKLLDFPLYQDTHSEHIRVNLNQCSKCKKTTTLDVDFIHYEINDKGENKENYDDFSLVYVLDANQAKQFIDKKNNPNGSDDAES